MNSSLEVTSTWHSPHPPHGLASTTHSSEHRHSASRRDRYTLRLLHEDDVIAAAPTAVRVCFQATRRERAARVRRRGPASRRQSGRRRATHHRQLATPAVKVMAVAATYARADHRPRPDEFRQQGDGGGLLFLGHRHQHGRMHLERRPSGAGWPTSAGGGVTVAFQARLGAARRCPGGRRVSVDGLSGCCCAMGWSPRPADCRHGPIRLLGENATGCWCAFRLPGAPAATRPRPGATTSGGRTKYVRWPVSRFSTFGGLGGRWRISPARPRAHAECVGHRTPVAPKALLRRGRGMAGRPRRRGQRRNRRRSPRRSLMRRSSCLEIGRRCRGSCQSTPSPASADL